MDRLPVLSSSQLKLCVLLIKSSGLINFASDDECEAVFLSLAMFGKRLLLKEQQTVEEREKYESMDLGALIGTVVSTPAKRELEAAALSSSAKRVKARSDDGGVVQPEAALTPAPRTPDARDNDLNQPVYWDVESSPNVVNVLRFDAAPLMIVFTARPALMGNHMPLTMYADLPKLLSLSRTVADEAKSRQSKNALRRLKKATVVYSKATPLPQELRKSLLALPWASKSFRSKLKFEDDANKHSDDDDDEGDGDADE